MAGPGDTFANLISVHDLLVRANVFVVRDDTCVREVELNAGASGVLRVGVRVKPGSSRTKVGGRYGQDLIVAVTAPAVDGRANEAVCRALAKELGLAPRCVQVVSGARGRSKVLAVSCAETQAIAAMLNDLMGPTGVSGHAGDGDPA